MENRNPNFIENLTNIGKGRPKGSKNKFKVNDVITDTRIQQYFEELHSIALEDKYSKNRIAAIQMLLERTLGKVPAEIHQTVTDATTLSDILDGE